MIGEAILEIEQAQLIEAVQEWLDKRWTVDPPVVTAVTCSYGGQDFQPVTFRVGLKSNLEFVVGEEESKS